MGHTTHITDGVHTVTLTATDYTLTDYNMQSGEIGGTVEESIGLYINGATAAALADNVRALQRLLTEAHNPDGRRVFIEMKLIGDTDFWRARLRGGTLSPAADIYRDYAAGWIAHTLNITRDSEWEGPRTQGAFAGGATIKAINNGLSNYAVLGTLDTDAPTQLELHFENTDGFALSPNVMYVGLDSVTGWNSTQHKLAPGNTSWAAAIGHSAILKGAECTNIEDMDGKPWRIIGAFTYVTPGAELKGATWVSIGGSNYIIDRSLPYIAPTNSGFLADLGTFVLPPNGRAGATDDLWVGYTGYHGTTGDANCNGLFLFPANQTRRYEFLKAPWADGEKLIDDMLEGRYYITANSGTQRVPQFKVSGPDLLYIPGKTNSLIAMLEEWGAGFPTYDANADMELTFYYRPRRLTI